MLGAARAHDGHAWRAVGDVGEQEDAQLGSSGEIVVDASGAARIVVQDQDDIGECLLASDWSGPSVVCACIESGNLSDGSLTMNLSDLRGDALIECQCSDALKAFPVNVDSVASPEAMKWTIGDYSELELDTLSDVIDANDVITSDTALARSRHCAHESLIARCASVRATDQNHIIAVGGVDLCESKRDGRSRCGNGGGDIIADGCLTSLRGEVCVGSNCSVYSLSAGADDNSRSDDWSVVRSQSGSNDEALTYVTDDELREFDDDIDGHSNDACCSDDSDVGYELETSARCLSIVNDVETVIIDTASANSSHCAHGSLITRCASVRATDQNTVIADGGDDLCGSKGDGRGGVDVADSEGCVDSAADIWTVAQSGRAVTRRCAAEARRKSQCASNWTSSQLWFVKVNACNLCSGTTAKAAALTHLLAQSTAGGASGKRRRYRFGRAYPDVVVVTELHIPAGTDLKEYLEPDIRRRYDVRWTLRSIDHRGDKLLPNRCGSVGGGVCLLVNRRLHMDVRPFKYDIAVGDEEWVDGHIGAWRLDPRPSSRAGGGSVCRSYWPQRSIVVIGGYIPPVQAGCSSGWSKPDIRDRLFNAMKSVMSTARRLRAVDDVFPVMLVHTNTNDGGCALNLGLEAVLDPLVISRGMEVHLRRQAARELPVQCDSLSDMQKKRTQRTCARLTIDDGKVVVRRHQCRAALVGGSSSSGLLIGDGRRFARMAAACGLVAVDGMTDHRQPTSYFGCRSCPDSSCVCKRRVRRGVLDSIFVDSKTIWDALTSPDRGPDILLARTVRGGLGIDGWSSCIDHCVSAARIRINAVEKKRNQYVINESGRGERRPRRVRLPTNLLGNFVVRRRIFDAMNSQMQVRVGLDYSGDGIDAIEDAIYVAAIKARDVGVGHAKSTCVGTTEPSKYKCVRQAKNDLDRAMRALSLAFKDRADKEGAAHAAARRERQSAAHVKWVSDVAARRTKHRRKRWQQPPEVVVSESVGVTPETKRIREMHGHVRRARAKLHTVVLSTNAKFMRLSIMKAPREFWRVQQQLATDAGNPVSKVNKLMQGLTDNQGKLISRDRNAIVDVIQDHRRAVFSVRSNLTDKCEADLSEALVVVSMFNKQLCSTGTYHANSVVVQVADDAMHVQRHIDVRRAKPLRQLAGLIAQHEEARRRHVEHESFRSGRKVRAEYGEHCDKLSADFSAMEVYSGMEKLRDVGSGTDSLEPIVLSFSGFRLQSENEFLQSEDNYDVGVPTVATAVVIAGFFNRLFCEGQIPERWLEHRCLLNYKGKAADPHYQGNYRGLGIDQAMMKLYSLVMKDRLEKFLVTTNGISRSQGGFQRQKGTPEQAFTMAETVRSRLRRCGVHMAFIDIEQAYDSVLHPLLWRACLDKGIDGRFLAMLQAIYYKASARVEIDGVLLNAIPLECGVLQGNPLSPLLFNIYIDQVIRALEEKGQRRRDAGGRAVPYGIPLPRVGLDPAVIASINNGFGEQADFLSNLFYADDGALFDGNARVLQEMLDFVTLLLSHLGLAVNTRKTKSMFVPAFDWHKNTLNEELSKLKPFTIGGVEIQRVEEFDYLGVLFNMQWDWSSAWRAAIARAAVVYHLAGRGGFDRKGTLDSMLTYAKGKIFSHLSYIMALTGAGGASSSAFYLKAREFVQEVLKKIVGYRFVDGVAVEIEAGVWDMQSRIDMLLLRFWCKVASMPHDAVVYRAMCLSIRSWQSVLVPSSDSVRDNGRIDQVKRQAWGQQLAAAASRVGLVVEDVFLMRVSAVVQVQVLAVNGDWSNVDTHALPAVASNSVRLVTRGREASIYSPLWTFPESSSITVATVFTTWTPTLKEACYESLRWRGNKHRQQLVCVFLQTQMVDNTPLRRWAMFTNISFQQPYWRSSYVREARRLLRLRFDKGPYEYNVRRRVNLHMLPDIEGRLREVAVWRLERQHRVCYCCGTYGDKSTYAEETLEHMLLKCSNPDMVAWRVQTRLELQRVADLVPAGGVSCPDFGNDTVLWTALMLCRGIGPVPVLQPGPYFECSDARSTALWVSSLTDPWLDILRNCRSDVSEVNGHAGCTLVDVAVRRAMEVFLVHRRCVRSSEAYHMRLRDPPDIVAKRQVAYLRKRKVAVSKTRRSRTQSSPFSRKVGSTSSSTFITNFANNHLGPSGRGRAPRGRGSRALPVTG